jgi:hypothetical protein
MRQTTRISLLLWALCVAAAAQAQLFPNLGGQRVGISALQFLKIGVGARAVAMGEAFVAVANDASALYWNPAGMAQCQRPQAFFAHSEYAVDIKHEFVGVVYRLDEQNVLGASFTSLHMDDMQVTTETQPFGTGEYFTFGDVAGALTYARKMTDQFSFGMTVRYAEETLDVLKMRAVVFDLGTYYWTGLGTTRFAVVISNFGADVTPKGSVSHFEGEALSTFQSFSAPTVFRLGIALDPVESGDHRLTTSLQLNHPNDNAENLRLGLEYAWSNCLFLRAGLKHTIGQPLFSQDATSEEGFAAGVGVRADINGLSLAVDYAYTDFRRLGSVHRISMIMGL